MQVSENPWGGGGGGVSKKVIIFPTFSNKSHKLIENFWNVFGNSLVTMHPNMQSRPQLLITGCFRCTEVHLFQFKRANATKQKILRLLEVSFYVILLSRIQLRKRLQLYQLCFHF